MGGGTLGIYLYIVSRASHPKCPHPFPPTYSRGADARPVNYDENLIIL